LTRIHGPSHGHADPIDPTRNGFHPAGDHLFTVQLLTEPDITAPALVVLSGCQTAVTGHRLPDEGIGLPAAFVGAGASGVVASAWPITDTAARLVFPVFYAALAVGTQPAEALQRAQRAAREHQLTDGLLAGAHPYRNPDRWGAYTYTSA
jgi:CHAT domain-containing protein